MGSGGNWQERWRGAICTVFVEGEGVYERLGGLGGGSVGNLAWRCALNAVGAQHWEVLDLKIL